jgi:integrase
MQRLGGALRDAEGGRTSPFATAAIRLLIFTGCRLREILDLEWAHVDLERGFLFLPTSKTGKKTVILSAPAIEVLTALPRLGPFVIPGVDPTRPRADLAKPWANVTSIAGLPGLRLHDLRHTFASVAAGASLGLPVIGKLLGHTQSSTTARYAHLDADPLRRAANTIGATIAAAMDRKGGGDVVDTKGRRDG